MYYDDDGPSGGGCVSGALIIAVALIAAAAIFYFGFNRAADAISPFNVAKRLNPVAPQPTTINVDRPAVVREIRGVNRLEAATASIDKVIEAGQEGNALYNLLVGDKLLLVAHGQVIAGFDMSKLRDEDIILSADASTATVTLLQRAAEEGRRDMTALIKSLGFKQVTVNASPGQCTMPGGQPLPPPQPTPLPAGQ